MKLYFVLAVLMAHLSATGAVADDPAPLRAAVRVLSPDSMPADGSGTQAPGAPRGALPQYRDQLHSPERAETVDINNAAVRFLVPLPERPIVIEARVTIDGRPYRMPRELRVDRLLTEIAAGPPTGKTEATPEDGQAEPPTVDNSIVARLARYARSTQHAPTRDEVHWFLKNWADGPVVLMLEENFQRARAGQTPLVTILDGDDNGMISAGELAGAQDRLLEVDANRDGVLSYEEIFEAADGLLRAGRTHTAPAQPAPLVPVADLLRLQTYRWLARLYQPAATSGTTPPMHRIDANDDGKLDEAEFLLLCESEPDLRVAVSFNTLDVAQSTIELNVVGPHIAPHAPATVRGSAITIQMAGALLELSAVQSRSGDKSDQISIGAVCDGYPFLPEIDPNDDGKLTIRELRDISPRLTVFDYNRDGSLSHHEILPTVRVSVGHGPIVHRHLSALRSPHQPPAQPSATPPEWFARMDKNQDHDLTRSEFLGTDEQFNQLDGDQDKLIDVAEAARDAGSAVFKPGQSSNGNSQSAPK